MQLDPITLPLPLIMPPLPMVLDTAIVTPKPHQNVPRAPISHIALSTRSYPAYDIAVKISQDALFLKKYADIADQSADDLVELITKPQEENFDYHYYTGASKGPSKYDASHWIGPEGYLCPSDVDYAKITRAVNVEGYWRIILQHIPEGYGYGHYNYTQTTRLETCFFPRLCMQTFGSLLPVKMHTKVCLPQNAVS